MLNNNISIIKECMLTQIKSGVTEMVSLTNYYKIRKLHYETDVVNDYNIAPQYASNFFMYVKNDIVFGIDPIDTFLDSTLFLTVFIKHGKDNLDITWGNNIVWPEDRPPILSSNLDEVDVLKFMTIDGNTWIGFISGLGYSPDVIPDIAYENENPYQNTEWPGTYEWPVKYPHRNFSRKRWWSYIFGDDR